MADSGHLVLSESGYEHLELVIKSLAAYTTKQTQHKMSNIGSNTNQRIVLLMSIPFTNHHESRLFPTASPVPTIAQWASHLISYDDQP